MEQISQERRIGLRHAGVGAGAIDDEVGGDGALFVTLQAEIHFECVIAGSERFNRSFEDFESLGVEGIGEALMNRDGDAVADAVPARGVAAEKLFLIRGGKATPNALGVGSHFIDCDGRVLAHAFEALALMLHELGKFLQR